MTWPRTLALLLFVPALLPAQMRVPGTSQASEPRTQEASASVPELSAGRNPLSTTVTGARTALGPGDLLEILVFDTPELTQRIRVDSHGDISLALIGDIHVQEMPPDELQKLIRRKLIDGHFLKDPQVSVFVAEYAGQMAYLTGEVNRPGAYPLLRSHRLSDLISVAGGPTVRAGNEVTIRREANPGAPIRVDLSDKDEERSNPEIMPGDNISVGQTGIVYVLGDVTRPGGFLIDRRSTLSVVQALALAEGTTTSASLTKAQLIRSENGARTEIPLNLKMMLKSQSPDVPLQAGDILFIPGSMTRGMGRRTIETVLSTASGVAIYANRP